MSVVRAVRIPRPRPRIFLARHAVRLAEKSLNRRLLPVEPPFPQLQPRYGHGRPPHPGLAAILRDAESAYRRNLEMFLSYREDLLAIPARQADSQGPWWENRWLPALDAVAIYGFLRSREPAAYFEVGSGISTMWGRRAVADGGLDTRITSIDPAPREPVEALCDRALRQGLEDVDPALFDELGAGDVLFMDGSHRVLMNSDATVFFMDVLPRLAPGVLVGVHDILLPDDYLPQWVEHYWSEQYLMATHLLAGGGTTELELAAHWAAVHSDLGAVCDPLWGSAVCRNVYRGGFALWFSVVEAPSRDR